MIRQFFRLLLYLLVSFKNLVFKHPGILGFLIGSILGFIMSLYMVRYGFPPITIPINTLVWGIAMAPVVKEYLEKITK